MFQHALLKFFDDFKAIQHELSDRAMVDFLNSRTHCLHAVGERDDGARRVDPKLFAEAKLWFIEHKFKATSPVDDFCACGHSGLCPCCSQKRDIDTLRGTAVAGEESCGRVSALFR